MSQVRTVQFIYVCYNTLTSKHIVPFPMAITSVLKCCTVS